MALRPPVVGKVGNAPKPLLEIRAAAGANARLVHIQAGGDPNTVDDALVGEEGFAVSENLMYTRLTRTHVTSESV